MLAGALFVFFASLCGIISLLALKRYELSREVVFAPSWRLGADAAARELKHRLIALEYKASRLWPQFLLICRYFIHLGALALARVLHRWEHMLHRLADRVSHRRNFSRTATRSQFLREVSDIRKKTEEPLDIQQ